MLVALCCRSAMDGGVSNRGLFTWEVQEIGGCVDRFDEIMSNLKVCAHDSSVSSVRA